MKTRNIILIALMALFLCSTYSSAFEVESASEAQTAKIKMALGKQYSVSKVLVVRSTNHQRAFYVGTAFEAEGVGKVVGIWLMSGSKDEPGMTLSVDGVAYQFSKLGKASDSKAGGSVTDPEAKALKGALDD